MDRTQVQNEIALALVGHREISLGTVDSYRAGDHTARVRLQPQDEPTGDVHVAVLWSGLRGPLEEGMSCVVALPMGHPAVILGTWYDDNRPAPAGSYVFPDDVHVLGNLTLAGMLTPAVLVNLPPAGAAFAHAVVAVAPTATVDGALWYCQPTHAGGYVWRAITLT